MPTDEHAEGLGIGPSKFLRPHAEDEMGVDCVRRRHFQRAIAEISAFEADNFSARRTIADIFGCWWPQGRKY